MRKVVTAAQMREMDRKTIEEVGIPGVVLMENAGAALVDAIRGKTGYLEGLRVNIFAGKGNNGGDGFVVGRLLQNGGAHAVVYLVADFDDLKGDAKINAHAFRAMGGKIKELTSEKRIRNFKLKFMHTQVVVDALMGTGATSAPKGFFTDVIEIMNSRGSLKVAVDAPTGVLSDGGTIPGAYFKADLTVTFGAAKVGLVTYPARSAVGELVTADISIPKVVYDDSPCAAFLLEDKDISPLLPSRVADSHKGTFGHLLVIGGSPGMGGSVALACAGAMRIGAGLVTAAVPDGMVSVYETGFREMMSIALNATAHGSIADSGFARLDEFSKGKNAILLGPGLSLNASTKEFVKKAVSRINLPMVIDADALTLIGEDIEFLRDRKAPTVITPHPGEMGALTGQTSASVQENRLECAKEYAAKSGAVVVLKGAGTVTADPSRRAVINTTGNHGLASGGSGDALSGMIGGLIAQGGDPFDSAIAAVYIHGKTADDYAETEADPRGFTASDLVEMIPKTLHKLTEQT